MGLIDTSGYHATRAKADLDGSPDPADVVRRQYLGSACGDLAA